MRRRTTIGRYVTDSNVSWREQLHPRLNDLLPGVANYIEDRMVEYTTTNVWGFPVDEQSVSNVHDVMIGIINDYITMCQGRRLWVYTETNGFWTEERITSVFGAAFINALWDIGKQMFIENYPQVADDLRHRTGKTFMEDSKHTYHDSNSHIETNSEQFGKHDNTQDKTHEHTDHSGSSTNNERSTHNERETQDYFQSPQDQGAAPNLGDAARPEFQSPDNMGESNLLLNAEGNALFATTKNNHFDDFTDTAASGQTSTDRTGHVKVNEVEYNDHETTVGSEHAADNNVGAKMDVDTGHERFEDLDVANVLQTFYDTLKGRLLQEIDNRLLPYFLNMKISRFTDHRIGRKEYV